MVLPRCLGCGKALKGRQSKYCSRQCKNNVLNLQQQSYEAQQKRGRDRKLELIRMKGGRCEMCGYHGNFAALEFHHEQPGKKIFQLDLRSLSNRKWDSIVAEAGKCKLVCSNCHSEIHNPDCLLD